MDKGSVTIGISWDPAKKNAVVVLNPDDNHAPPDEVRRVDVPDLDFCEILEAVQDMLLEGGGKWAFDGMVTDDGA